MSVEKEARLDATNIAAKRLETQMDVIVSVMNVAWRIMCHEHIYRRKRSKKRSHLILAVQMVTAWLVAPRTAETAESQTAETLCAKVQVNDWSWEWTSAVVITFDREDA